MKLVEQQPIADNLTTVSVLDEGGHLGAVITMHKMTDGPTGFLLHHLLREDIVYVSHQTKENAICPQQ